MCSKHVEFLQITVFKYTGNQTGKNQIQRDFLGFFQNLSSKPTLAGYSKRRINFGQPNV